MKLIRNLSNYIIKLRNIYASRLWSLRSRSLRFRSLRLFTDTTIVIVVLLFIAVILYHLVYGHFFRKREGIDRQWHEYVDAIYYINLDHRKDRNTEITGELHKMGVPPEKIVRISAVNKPGQGDLGCSLSHVNTMSQFIDSSHNTCIVLEDDFTFTRSLEEINTAFRDVFEKNVLYDVILLAVNEIDVQETEYEYLKKVNSGQTTSGYMVNKHFATTLYQNYRDGVKLLEDSYMAGKSDKLQGPFCIDQYWKRIQPQSNWYMFSPKFGVQRKSHSDIQGGVVDPGV